MRYQKLRIFGERGATGTGVAGHAVEWIKSPPQSRHLWAKNGCVCRFRNSVSSLHRALTGARRDIVEAARENLVIGQA